MKKIEDLKKGEYFKLKATSKEVYQAEGYCRQNKKYTGSAESDISKFTYKKKGTLVETDFEY